MATAPFVLIIEPGLTATLASSGSKNRYNKLKTKFMH